MNLLAILESLEGWILLFEWVVEKRLYNVSELPPSMQLLVCRHLGVDLCSTICLFEGKNIVLCNCLCAGIWGLTCAVVLYYLFVWRKKYRFTLAGYEAEIQMCTSFVFNRFVYDRFWGPGFWQLGSGLLEQNKRQKMNWKRITPSVQNIGRFNIFFSKSNLLNQNMLTSIQYEISALSKHISW